MPFCGARENQAQTYARRLQTAAGWEPDGMILGFEIAICDLKGKAAEPDRWSQIVTT
jgi:hypothetical protein